MASTDLFHPIQVDGLNQLRKSLKAGGEGAEKEIRPALNEAAGIVVRVAQGRMPSLTGAARRSVRVSSTSNKVRVTAGGSRAPYYPWLDYGGRTGRGGSIVRPFDKGGRYLYPAYGAQRKNIMALLEKRIVAVIERNGLDVT
jgi:hypothetical protein